MLCCTHCTLQEDTSLSKVHTLFRQLGLRHLAVIPRASCVMGVITRHDLLPEALEETFMGQQAPLGAGAQALPLVLVLGSVGVGSRSGISSQALNQDAGCAVTQTAVVQASEQVVALGTAK